jgi:hypothetical protein
MCKNFSIYFNLFVLTTILFVSCKKHEVKVMTSQISELTSTSATSGGEITDDGGQNILEYGVCWSTNSNPTIADFKTIDGSGKGSFSSYIKDLKHKTTYYLRAYAKHSAGISYGNLVSFYTPQLISTTIPIVYTYEISKVDTTNLLLQLNAEIMHQGGSDLLEKGFVWNLKGGPSISDNKIISSSNQDVYYENFNFQMSTEYHVKSYAVNSFGTSYGQEITFKIEKAKPKVNTNEIIEIDSNYAICTAEVTYSGGAAIIERGICWATFSNPTINDSKVSQGTGLGSFTTTLTDLLPNTQYYCRSYATNSEGTTYGREIAFRTMVGKLYIGMQYKGGIIFYLAPMKGGGLLVSNDDLSSSSSWGCSSNVPNATLTTLGGGEDNSTAIENACGASGAVKLCRDYKYGKYDDWYLPSIGELELIYKSLKETDKEKFSIGYYWSSTQKDVSTAYRYGFLGGNSGDALKTSNQFVRAVRKF